ncbi:MAG: response regulator [Desulfovibrio sp.]|jgi:signal transduction histidine kinase/DNA-binding response OmpR family regulator|nr:response regulator [Desulfovibrio sp.]
MRWKIICVITAIVALVTVFGMAMGIYFSNANILGPVAKNSLTLILSGAIFLSLGLATAIVASGRIARAFLQVEGQNRNLTLLNEKISQASAAKGNFLANMSHEMRTPLNAVIGMTAIAKSAREVERKNYCLDKIEEASTHLLGVINDILDMSKIEAGKFELSGVEFNFEKMLQRVSNVVSLRAEEKHLDFRVRIDGKIPRMLFADDQRLAQVVANLLSNAVKFTPENGAVSLDACLEKEESDLCTIRIDIRDTGIGISEEQRAKLFSSFEQAQSDTARKFGGTGLGLAISKRIVGMMGGEIRVESELAKGSTFSFTIRARKVEEKQCGLLPPGVHLRNMRVLAVDDAPDVREYFRDIGRRIGVDFHTAAAGGEAISLIGKNGPYDLYFIDWKMPEMDGIELARRIREGEADRCVVIMISAAELGSVEEEAREAGVNKFLSKPLFPSSIVDCINECIGLENRLGGEEPPVMEGNFSGRRVLLAEDIEINREIVLSLLEPTGLAVDCAENGAEAVRKFSAAPGLYSLILMDVQMPEMDGYEATRRIRELADAGAREVPIVAMTANVFREDIERCLKAGMNDHVGKPLNCEELFTVLRKYLRPAATEGAEGAEGGEALEHSVSV